MSVVRPHRAMSATPGVPPSSWLKTIEYRSQHGDLLRALAVTDPLTGLANFRHLAESIDRSIERARVRRESLAVMLLDVDHLKTINDRDGHLAGDRTLRAVGAAIRARLRSADLACRYGGDEFCVLLPETDLTGAGPIAERLREGIAAYESALPLLPPWDAASQSPDALGFGDRERYRAFLASLYDNLGVALMRAERLDECAEPIERALALDAGRGKFHYSLGLCHFNGGRYAAAVSAFEAAGRAPSPPASLPYDLGRALGQWLEPDRIAAIIQRRDAMAAAVDKLVAKNGRARVIIQ